eukprot:3934296-Rhodomonas_salina.1
MARRRERSLSRRLVSAASESAKREAAAISETTYACDYRVSAIARIITGLSTITTHQAPPQLVHHLRVRERRAVVDRLELLVAA